jgi:hypothetical protein
LPRGLLEREGKIDCSLILLMQGKRRFASPFCLLWLVST